MANKMVESIKKPLDIKVTVPGSKSITNRALLMAALSKGECRLNGVLFSDDSRHFLGCLESLGFLLQINEEEKYVVLTGNGGSLPKSEATIDVGSAGTAARFLTAMLAVSDGKYIINSSEQMKKRPMNPLFEALSSMGAEFTFLEEPGHLPVEVIGAAFGGRTPKPEVDIDISESTQFLSALMMVAPALRTGLTINITSKKTDGSYIRITRQLMKQFGSEVDFDGKTYVIKSGDYKAGIYQIEPDVSAACYFYGAAAITGGKALVKNVTFSSMQGDIKFLSVLEKMGCQLEETDEGIRVCGPKEGELKGIDLDMNDFSDQALTLGAVATFANSPTTIRNIGHIRLQESDRINAMVTELRKLGVTVEEGQDWVKVYPSAITPAEIDTYDDHRVAMSFGMIGLKVPGMVIKDYMCCRKTFEEYFQVLDEIVRG